MIQNGMWYFQHRYKSNNIINKQIAQINEVLQVFDYNSKFDAEMKEEIKMYNTRHRLLSPPIIDPDKKFYHALCIHCYGYDRKTSNSASEAIKNVEHNSHCTYLKSAKRYRDNPKRLELLNQQYIHIVKPKK